MVNWDKTKIALDFDETYTVNPEMWDSIVALMLTSNCDVRFVTYRYENAPGNADILAAAQKLGIEIIFCNYYQKAQVTAIHNWIPDIWIDDMPVLIPMKQQLQGILMGIEKSDSQAGIKEMMDKHKKPVVLPKIHIVKPGESLYKIAEMYTGNGDLWNVLRDHNKIVFPHKIYPGQEIMIPPSWWGKDTAPTKGTETPCIWGMYVGEVCLCPKCQMV